MSCDWTPDGPERLPTFHHIAMRLTRVLSLFAVVLLVVAGAAIVQRQRSDGVSEPWYHASDVALLAKTGRPQLVEFFHPD